MNILITGASTQISELIASALAGAHRVTLTDRVQSQAHDNFVLSALDHDSATNDLVRGMDVVVHSAGVGGGGDVSDQLDGAMRCLYNLVNASVDEGVPRFVFLSSLDVVGRHSEDYVVTERWRAAPTTEPDVLSLHLGEFICREFAREQKIEVVCLRLGDLDQNAGRPPSSSVLYVEDAVQAVERALTADISGGYAGSRSYWGLFHIQSTVPNQRFLTDTAEVVLGYSPGTGAS